MQEEIEIRNKIFEIKYFHRIVHVCRGNTWQMLYLNISKAHHQNTESKAAPRSSVYLPVCFECVKSSMCWLPAIVCMTLGWKIECTVQNFITSGVRSGAEKTSRFLCLCFVCLFFFVTDSIAFTCEYFFGDIPLVSPSRRCELTCLAAISSHQGCDSKPVWWYAVIRESERVVTLMLGYNGT